jgi:hypothetical protein
LSPYSMAELKRSRRLKKSYRSWNLKMTIGHIMKMKWRERSQEIRKRRFLK